MLHFINFVPSKIYGNKIFDSWNDNLQFSENITQMFLRFLWSITHLQLNKFICIVDILYQTLSINFVMKEYYINCLIRIHRASGAIFVRKLHYVWFIYHNLYFGVAILIVHERRNFLKKYSFPCFTWLRRISINPKLRKFCNVGTMFLRRRSDEEEPRLLMFSCNSEHSVLNFVPSHINYAKLATLLLTKK